MGKAPTLPAGNGSTTNLTECLLALSSQGSQCGGTGEESSRPVTLEFKTGLRGGSGAAGMGGGDDGCVSVDRNGVTGKGWNVGTNGGTYAEVGVGWKGGTNVAMYAEVGAGWKGGTNVGWNGGTNVGMYAEVGAGWKGGTNVGWN